MSADTVVGKQNTAGARPRVLLVGPFPPTTGGVTTFMLNLMASFASEQYQFVPFTTSRPPKKNVTKNWGYGAVLRGGLRRVLAGILITLKHLAIFPFKLRGIDLVQIQASDYQVFWESALYAAMARALGKPVVFRIGGAFDIFHGGSSAFLRRMIARALRLPDCIVVQSLFARNYVGGIVETKQIVLPNWSRVGVSPPRDGMERVSNPVFLFIAGPEAERKGVRVLLSSIAHLASEDTKARFRLVAVPEILANEIAALDLGSVVSTEGTLSRERVLAAMDETHAFLLPSYGEGFPNSLVEAMAAGMASIVTPVGAVPEMVSDGGALTVEVGSTEQLTDAIRHLSGDGALRKRLSEEAQRMVFTRYTAEAALNPLLEQYAALLRTRELTTTERSPR